eukprot:CAMPEP_0184491024 /NCGR_PEP_ID=MMETSP0113_2-20130426/19449_1 /TAXON_ID=91329 /ORGANISM="Norrisiella sphaerica, Strain BC52" /LENGTH=375 /DNA_ID=CAMNT_0026875197 /DNA_START=143 /DNA_END=1270 /DNA_ORIENTATION=-
MDSLHIAEDLWIQYVDAESGVPYYHNLTSLETSWDTPEAFLVHPSVIDWIQEAEPEDRNRRATIIYQRSPTRKSRHAKTKSLDSKANRRSIAAIIKPRPLNSPPRNALRDAAAPKSRYIIICAVEEEAKHVREQMRDLRDIPLAGIRRRSRGKIGAHVVDLVLSDIGVSNAASAATALCLEEGQGVIKAILSVGCSGAHLDTLELGDVVIGSGVASVASMRVKANAEVEFKGFQTVLGETNAQILKSDPVLLDTAARLADSMKFPTWPENKQAPKVITGIVASSDIWRQNKESIGTVHNEFKSVCEEMEAGAIAVVCAKFNIPFLAIKDISNNELLKTEESAAGTCANGLGLRLDEIGRRAALLATATIHVIKIK